METSTGKKRKRNLTNEWTNRLKTNLTRIVYPSRSPSDGANYHLRTSVSIVSNVIYDLSAVTASSTSVIFTTEHVSGHVLIVHAPNVTCDDDNVAVIRERKKNVLTSYEQWNRLSDRSILSTAKTEFVHPLAFLRDERRTTLRTIFVVYARSQIKRIIPTLRIRQCLNLDILPTAWTVLLKIHFYPYVRNENINIIISFVPTDRSSSNVYIRPYI